MPVVKDTVDRLMKGYDIRLRPDFGGKESKRAFGSFNMHVMMCMNLHDVQWLVTGNLVKFILKHKHEGYKQSWRELMHSGSFIFIHHIGEDSGWHV